MDILDVDECNQHSKCKTKEAFRGKPLFVFVLFPLPFPG
jgi:hypothetical protein